ncbi:amidohydrolase family protein [Vallitalea pronyensis]|uniref:Amidohydrolase family protein n=1 Tax=Vallitalea pronyensis TaxID=1348613 RepID=A0A8J8MK70_9FIRM|nr:amidohydrolase family protein [Vallitalea pronyensis]QUI23180.1 amidohydrolase family protein [Vallitalea pronyensis]
MNKSNSLVIKNVHLVTMTDHKIKKNKTVIIDNGIIRSINDSNIDTTRYKNVMDGKGKYLMPGLINMHTHLGDNPDDLTLYLVNGVTTIRNMWGYGGFKLKHWLFGIRVFNHLELKRKINKGDIIGPRIFTAGPLLDGEKPFLPKFMPLRSLKNTDIVEDIIKEQVAKGYDFIKIYHMLSMQNFQEIIKAAEKHHIPVAGHVPDAVGIKKVLESNVRSIEHLYGFINPYHPESNVKEDNIQAMASLAAKTGTWNCPTLVAHERLANVKRQEEFEHEHQMNYVSKRNKKAMRFLIKKSNELYVKKNVKGNHDYMDKLYHIIQVLKEEGAGILLGTDKAVPYVVAGFSEHLEMKLLMDAGLSNYEAIQAATINAATCLNQEKEIGTIEIGKKADLILTHDNPLSDIHTIFNHMGVIKNGKFYSRETCDALLKGIKKPL